MCRKTYIPIGKSTKLTIIISLDSVANNRISRKIGRNGAMNRFSLTIHIFAGSFVLFLSPFSLYLK